MYICVFQKKGIPENPPTLKYQVYKGRDKNFNNTSPFREFSPNFFVRNDAFP